MRRSGRRCRPSCRAWRRNSLRPFPRGGRVGRGDVAHMESPSLPSRTVREMVLRSGREAIVGSSLGISLWGTVPVAELARQAHLAEAIGCDSVWVIDSQLLCREVYVTL